MALNQKDFNKITTMQTRTFQNQPTAQEGAMSLGEELLAEADEPPDEQQRTPRPSLAKPAPLDTAFSKTRPGSCPRQESLLTQALHSESDSQSDDDHHTTEALQALERALALPAPLSIRRSTASPLSLSTRRTRSSQFATTRPLWKRVKRGCRRVKTPSRLDSDAGDVSLSHAERRRMLSVLLPRSHVLRPKMRGSLRNLLPVAAPSSSPVMRRPQFSPRRLGWQAHRHLRADSLCRARARHVRIAVPIRLSEMSLLRMYGRAPPSFGTLGSIARILILDAARLHASMNLLAQRRRSTNGPKSRHVTRLA
ncbi:hypothetical protein MPH_06106 [Macrophomina phaseolina MS6]|uniref:Uncharacterized protein n=1 Tax=Macrophomina phaseolina (strain MS6) TaxID=1126212 RepID=K2RVC5_MACPH|nr:hypothetical protein MPH_06106 [Macrophomina phaseolina MS6]